MLTFKCCALLSIFLANTALGLQASFEPAANNTIYEDNPSYASGQSTYLFIGPIASGSPRRALLRFDLSSLPAEARVTGASLRLIIDRAARNADTSDPISLHRVLNTWGQGTSNAGSGGSGTQASAGDATWEARFYHTPPAAPSLLWNLPGGDFSAAASAAQPLGITLGSLSLTASDGLISDLQGWIANPAANHGWILRLAEGEEYKARRFYGRNALSPADRPLLTVTYDLMPADEEIPTLGGWAMLLLILSVLGIARARL